MAKKLQLPEQKNSQLLFIGSVLFIVYYLADCALDSLVFAEGTFTQNLINPSLHEVAIRALSGLFLFSLFIISSILLNKNRNLQSQLVKQTQEILTNNRELEAYQFALSQELRTSLARVTLARELLVDSVAQGNSHLSTELFEHLEVGCEKMSNQIDGMLTYSAANRSNLNKKRIAIDDLAREITKELAGNTEGSALDVQIDNKLETECDPDLMRIALKNLIDNAIKFRSPERHAEIYIGMEKRRGVPVYFIRDNGRGFDQSLADRLFKPFERSPETENLPGSGVGLATANNIIERHGGRLWAEGATDDGATFYFTL